MKRHYRSASAKANCLFPIFIFNLGGITSNLFFLFTFAFLVPKGQAQIVPDATLPVNSSVTPEGNINIIEGGTRAGSNLFHSFREFSIPNGTEAFFNNGLDIRNILTRVTGSSTSNIDGLIKANGTANLFLINPNGIIFGPNARLNIGGSFFASTANSVRFADGTQFSATNPQATPLLTISVPIGLQFNGLRSLSAEVQNLGTIAVQGSNLSVQTGRTLAIVGGNVTISGSNNPQATGLTAGGIPFVIVEGNPKPTTPGGRIELGSVTEGNVTLTFTQLGFALDYADIQNFGDIQLRSGATVSTSGTGGGEIQIQARALRLSEGSRIASFTLGSLPGGKIVAHAWESVELIGTGGFAETFQQLSNPTADPSKFRSGLFTLSSGSGDAGAIEINTGRLRASDGAFVLSSSLSQGKSRPITVNASDSVEVIGSLLGTGNRTGSTGAAGDFTINTQNLILRDGAVVSAGTDGSGWGGTLTVKSSESMELIGGNPFYVQDFLVNTNLSTSTLGTATAGDLRITTRKLTIRDGAYASADTFGEGGGGILDVKASDSVEVMGRSVDGMLLSNLSTNSRGVGAAGDLRIATERLIVRDGASISANSAASGNAGNINITARSIRLNNGATLSSNTQGGQGNITVGARNLVLRDKSNITTNATGTATGGNIDIGTDVLAASGNSDISANAPEFKGGKVTINAQSIFGAQPRTQEELQSLLNTDSTRLDAKQLPSSDITATGASSDLAGTLQVNTSTALQVTQLSQNFAQATLVASSCRR